MSLSKTPEDLIARARAVGGHLEKLIKDKKPVVSRAVAAPFGSHDSISEGWGDHQDVPPFADSPWTGEWGDADDY